MFIVFINTLKKKLSSNNHYIFFYFLLIFENLFQYRHKIMIIRFIFIYYFMHQFS